MLKIMDLTPEQFKLFKKDTNRTKPIKTLLDIPKKNKIGVGDSFVNVGQKSKENEVYMEEWNGKKYYYVVAKPVDEISAFCYSIYSIT